MYYTQIKDVSRAIGYCDMVWDRAMIGDILPLPYKNVQNNSDKNNRNHEHENENENEHESSVYLYLMTIILSPEIPIPFITTSKNDEISNDTHNTNDMHDKTILAVSLAERYFRRLDAHAFLSLLPDNTPYDVIERYVILVEEFKQAFISNSMIVNN